MTDRNENKRCECAGTSLVPAARKALERYWGVRPEIWNDAPSRTHAEVLAALRAAADAEERNG